MNNSLFSHAMQHHFHEATVASILALGLLILFAVKQSGSSHE
ncbi:hypothetical protein LNTAR_02297 [Lentisphaera araneosa HTCC2155]|uniref:Uncharacterized protein n=1 Tax=Lentisphaera araneosa HTCC2155 TaxID=313628 RepID=A6DP69_9BACT|nr:hypothetical protein [Lentisphaera araneosa]EDM26601.1 hypothetical protein LNTAR_02297 [Lentisphaera araneosa HTCC2155]